MRTGSTARPTRAAAVTAQQRRHRHCNDFLRNKIFLPDRLVDGCINVDVAKFKVMPTRALETACNGCRYTCMLDGDPGSRKKVKIRVEIDVQHLGCR